MKDFMAKYMETTVFTEFKKSKADVVEAITNQLELNLDNEEKIKQFLDKPATIAEVINIVDAHFKAITMPWVKQVCINIDGFLGKLDQKTVALQQGFAWLSSEQRAQQREQARLQILLLGFPNDMPPEDRHMFISNMLLQVTELSGHLLQNAPSDQAHLIANPLMALNLLGNLPSTLTIGQNKYSHLTIINFKAHYLRDWFFKHYAKNTSLPLMDAQGRAVPKSHIKIQLGAPAFQRRLESIIRVALKANADYHGGRESTKLIILWKTLTIMSPLDAQGKLDEYEAIFSAAYTQHEDGYIICDVTVTPAFNTMLSTTNSETGKTYWQDAWNAVIRVNHHQIEATEMMANQDEPMVVDTDEAASSSAASSHTHSARPRRHYTEPFAKDNNAFPMYVVWKVAAAPIPYDSDDFDKKINSRPPASASAAASSSKGKGKGARASYVAWKQEAQHSLFDLSASQDSHQDFDEEAEVLKFRTSNFLHWKMPNNWKDTGGPLNVEFHRLLGVNDEDLALVFRLPKTQLVKMTRLQQVDWVAILEEILANPEDWIKPDNHLTTASDIFTTCSKIMSLKEIKEGKHQTYGAWLMDFLYTELLIRSGQAEKHIAYKAVPNEVYDALWKQINDVADKWDTSASNATQIGNIFEVYASFLFMKSDRRRIRSLILAVIKASKLITDITTLCKERPLEAHYPKFRSWNIDYCEAPQSWE